MLDIMLEFYIYSAAGWLMEGFWSMLTHGRFRDKRMFVSLPLCPVYGIGGVVLAHMLGGFSDNLILLFIFGAAAASAVELAYFLVYKAAYGVMVWDYSKMRANFEGGICAGYSLLWGLLAVVFVKFAAPASGEFVGNIPLRMKFICNVFFGILLLADIKKTDSVFRNFKSGAISELPECFWYMRKKS